MPDIHLREVRFILVNGSTRFNQYFLGPMLLARLFRWAEHVAEDICSCNDGSESRHKRIYFQGCNP